MEVWARDVHWKVDVCSAYLVEHQGPGPRRSCWPIPLGMFRDIGGALSLNSDVHVAPRVLYKE